METVKINETSKVYLKRSLDKLSSDGNRSESICQHCTSVGSTDFFSFFSQNKQFETLTGHLHRLTARCMSAHRSAPKENSDKTGTQRCEDAFCLMAKANCTPLGLKLNHVGLAVVERHGKKENRVLGIYWAFGTFFFTRVPCFSLENHGVL